MHLKATYTLNIFIAYHPKDQVQFEELLHNLEGLDKKNAGYVVNKVWYDGTDLSESGRASIRELTEAADLVLLLMSDNSILSPFFISQELRETLQQHDNEQSIVVPIILNTCWWEDTVFRNLDVLPRAGLPIYDSSNIKNELFDQVVQELDRKLEKVRQRKEELEETFKSKITEAEAIFNNWQKRPGRLRAALPLYKEAVKLWREGFAPDIKIIEAHVDICHREIDFRHYSKAAHEAYKNQDYQTCFFNCKDALDLRDDAVIRRLYNKVKNYLDEIELKEKRAPFEAHLTQGHEYFLALMWKKAKEQYTLALEHYQPNFMPERKIIERKIKICEREAILEFALSEATRLYSIQNYQRMAHVLIDSIQTINHEALYRIEHATKLIGYLQHVEPFLDKKTDKWGFVNNKTHNIIIAPKYTAAYNFSENLAGVKKWERWGFIDIEGNEVIPFLYNYVSHFQNGIAQVIKNGETYCINHKGERVEADVYQVEVPIDTPDDEIPKLLPPDLDGIL
ncbi:MULTISPECIES: WG repeat-containing protein [unclassified Aureispira]|uniref:WG repeat-containing protein n=1 Tax=unclassified Aureispira TaxID=2649989 RepID=UPI0007C68107|nr:MULTISPECIES: WG repeat-containing protein [unclassified Aureispira]WMX11997.1 WG repeat-containing protein [Aureispira sp. CCB-E]